MLMGLVGIESKRAVAGPPPVAVTVNKAASQLDPTNASPILFTIIFSEAVTGFLNTHVNFAGSTVGGTKSTVLTGGPTTYTASVSGMAAPSGDLVAQVPANSCTSVATGAFNANSTSTDNIVAWSSDVTAPSVTVNKEAGQADPTSATSILFTAVFSEAVVGFTSADVSFTGSTVGGTLAASITGTGPTYTITVTGMATTNGNVVCSIPAGVCTDAIGNLNTASTHTDNIVAWTGAPAGAWYDLFVQTLSTDSAGWANFSMRQIISPSAYLAGAPATGTKLRTTIQAGPAGASWFGISCGHQAPTGDPWNYDGNQIQQLWSGVITGSVGANGTRTSDGVTPFAFDKTKTLVLAVAFDTTASDVKRSDPGTGYNGGFFGAGYNDTMESDTFGTYTMTAGRLYFFTKVEVFG
jgi:hypothetical protein